MKKLLALALGFASLTLPSIAQPQSQPQSSFWKDRSGNPIAETESMKSKDDFAGSVLLTIDENWAEKWNTPPETKPNFNLAETVPFGKKVFVLIFFANPKVDEQGNANVRCDLQIAEPTGKVALDQKNVTCYSGKIKGSPYNLYLSAPVITFNGDPDDPTGRWEVRVVLRDALRNIDLPLHTSFVLSAK